jgi:predicted transposase/invertase (TIGR01784 family)
MPLGIRPTNDFAFKKTFGTVENKQALISLLNAVLDLPSSIVDVTLENPYNLQDFKEDKLSILDIKAVDDFGAIYNVEMQLTIFDGLVQRIVFYGCEIYAGQLKTGDDYTKLHPAFSICLVNGVLWKDARQVHHAFRLTDQKTGRILGGTLEIHTLELGWYTLKESELSMASMFDCWLYWFIHAHEYDTDALMKLFPQPAIQQATRTITQIAQKTEDKAMYDAREKVIRDQQWALNAAHREGEIKGEIKLVRTLQEILGISISEEHELHAMDFDQLKALAADLQQRVRGRRLS